MATKKLEPSDITVLCDNREAMPFDLSPLKMEPATLQTGDYSLKGLEHYVTVERKSLQDLIGSLSSGRERFDREMQRILAYPARLVVVEGSLDQIVAKQYRSQMEPNAILGSIMGYMCSGIPFLLCKDRQTAALMTARFLFIAARRRWEEAQGLVANLKIAR